MTDTTPPRPELLPTRAAHTVGDPVAIDLSGQPSGARLVVTRLGSPVADRPVTADAAQVDLGALPPGGYGADLLGADGARLASTAFDVWTRPFERVRYGFVAHHGPETDPDATARHFRRLHLTAAQFYDWAWRYTDLLGPQTYADTLGNQVCLSTVRAVIAALHQAGVAALGYVALYGVPIREWDQWAAMGLYQADGTPYRLGEDFLGIVDPGDPRWQARLVPQFAPARASLGFDGFHLDQYGWPKQALRADGTLCDLTEAFPRMIRRIAEADPAARLIFNNVNGFPLAQTASSPQAALYTEVWAPRSDLRDLSALAAASRALGGASKPTVLAAYLSVYRTEPARVADRTARLMMATVFSQGATCLLNGETGSVLTDPYYPDNHRADGTTLALMRRWQDFLVRYGDLLVAPEVEEVTGEYFAGINQEIALEAPGVRVSVHPDAGTVWARVTRTPAGLTLHLINLTGQVETGWDTPKQAIEPVTGLVLRLRQVGPEPWEIFWADPDQPGPWRRLTADRADRQTVHRLPPLGAWAMVHIPFPTADTKETQ